MVVTIVGGALLQVPRTPHAARRTPHPPAPPRRTDPQPPAGAVLQAKDQEGWFAYTAARAGAAGFSVAAHRRRLAVDVGVPAVLPNLDILATAHRAGPPRLLSFGADILPTAHRAGPFDPFLPASPPLLPCRPPAAHCAVGRWTFEPLTTDAPRLGQVDASAAPPAAWEDLGPVLRVETLGQGAAVACAPPLPPVSVWVIAAGI